MKHPRIILLALASVVPWAACTDPVDRAAKQRIFSPEDPPAAVASASEQLPPENVADDPRIARRILGMGAAETTERIGAHVYRAKVSFEWAGNQRSTKLEETRTLVAGAGGVSGDFHGVIENNRDQGLEVMRVQGAVYARSRYMKFRQRLRDRGIAEREREEIYGAIRDVDALFRGRLKLMPQGTVTVDGRTAWKYDVSLGPPLPASERALPPRPQPKGLVDAATAHRLAFFELRSPQSLQGQVLVDAKTSVVLKARLDGRLAVAQDGGAGNLRIVLESALTEVGKEPNLKAPAEFLPDQDKPQGIADALDRFGIPRNVRDAGATDEGPDDSD